jgi:hypothetical protein
VPGGLLVVGMGFMPESPRWCAASRGAQSARTVLASIRNLPEDHLYLSAELQQIMDQIEQERTARPDTGIRATLQVCAQRSNRNRLLIGNLMFVFMQMAGSNAINYYSPRIFKSIGLNGANTGLYATGIYGGVQNPDLHSATREVR